MALELVHRARVPQGGQEPRWPAVVMIHGWLGNENVMSIFERTVPASVAIISPRAPIEVEAGSYGWFKLNEPDTFDAGLGALERFVRALPEAYPLDPARLVLMGFSQGAAMSLSLLLKEPPLVMAVASLAGFLPREALRWATPGRAAGKRVFMAHGTDDDTVPVAWARDAAGRLRESGAAVDLREYTVGHKLNAQGTRDLRHWLAGIYGTRA
jgi:phospholipase/carboxylesterase